MNTPPGTPPRRRQRLSSPPRASRKKKRLDTDALKRYLENNEVDNAITATIQQLENPEPLIQILYHFIIDNNPEKNEALFLVIKTLRAFLERQDGERDRDTFTMVCKEYSLGVQNIYFREHAMYALEFLFDMSMKLVDNGQSIEKALSVPNALDKAQTVLQKTPVAITDENRTEMQIQEQAYTIRDIYNRQQKDHEYIDNKIEETYEIQNAIVNHRLQVMDESLRLGQLKQHRRVLENIQGIYDRQEYLSFRNVHQKRILLSYYCKNNKQLDDETLRFVVRSSPSDKVMEDIRRVLLPHYMNILNFKSMDVVLRELCVLKGDDRWSDEVRGLLTEAQARAEERGIEAEKQYTHADDIFSILLDPVDDIILKEARKDEQLRKRINIICGEAHILQGDSTNRYSEFADEEDADMEECDNLSPPSFISFKENDRPGTVIYTFKAPRGPQKRLCVSKNDRKNEYYFSKEIIQVTGPDNKIYSVRIVDKLNSGGGKFAHIAVVDDPNLFRGGNHTLEYAFRGNLQGQEYDIYKIEYLNRTFSFDDESKSETKTVEDGVKVEDPDTWETSRDINLKF